MKCVIPLKLPSLMNTRMHWRAMAKLKKEQKAMVTLFMAGEKLPPLPAVVTITRVGKRKLDSDNLAACAKYARDSIAALYGVDDGSDKYEWVYKQKIGQSYAVEVEIVSAT